MLLLVVPLILLALPLLLVAMPLLLLDLDVNTSNTVTPNGTCGSFVALSLVHFGEANRQGFLSNLKVRTKRNESTRSHIFAVIACFTSCTFTPCVPKLSYDLYEPYNPM